MQILDTGPIFKFLTIDELRQCCQAVLGMEFFGVPTITRTSASRGEELPS